MKSHAKKLQQHDGRQGEATCEAFGPRNQPGRVGVSAWPRRESPGSPTESLGSLGPRDDASHGTQDEAVSWLGALRDPPAHGGDSMPLLSMGHKEIGRTASSSIGKAMRKGAVVGIPGPPKRSDRISPAPRAPKPASQSLRGCSRCWPCWSGRYSAPDCSSLTSSSH